MDVLRENFSTQVFFISHVDVEISFLIDLHIFWKLVLPIFFGSMWIPKHVCIRIIISVTASVKSFPIFWTEPKCGRDLVVRHTKIPTEQLIKFSHLVNLISTGCSKHILVVSANCREIYIVVKYPFLSGFLHRIEKFLEKYPNIRLEALNVWNLQKQKIVVRKFISFDSLCLSSFVRFVQDFIFLSAPRKRKRFFQVDFRFTGACKSAELEADKVNLNIAWQFMATVSSTVYVQLYCTTRIRILWNLWFAAENLFYIFMYFLFWKFFLRSSFLGTGIVKVELIKNFEKKKQTRLKFFFFWWKICSKIVTSYREREEKIN